MSRHHRLSFSSFNIRLQLKKIALQHGNIELQKHEFPYKRVHWASFTWESQVGQCLARDCWLVSTPKWKQLNRSVKVCKAKKGYFTLKSSRVMVIWWRNAELNASCWKLQSQRIASEQCPTEELNLITASNLSETRTQHLSHLNFLNYLNGAERISSRSFYRFEQFSPLLESASQELLFTFGKPTSCKRYAAFKLLEPSSQVQ